MPRFFFNVFDGTSEHDAEGTELTDWKEAQLEAVRLAGRLISDDAKRLALGEDWCMEVVNESGLVLFRLNFCILGSSAIMGSSRGHDDRL